MTVCGDNLGHQMQRLLLATVLMGATVGASGQSWIEYPGGDGAGSGKHVVLVSGDEEYRSEEGLPQLARILSTRHGFRTTVLFAIDPESGIINPHVRDNIPGLEHLRDADLLIILTRWRVLPDNQMAEVDAYLKQGKPVIGLRTATHAFAPPESAHARVRTHLRTVAAAESNGLVPPAPPAISDDAWGLYGHYGDGYFGPQDEWMDGFGRLVLGERWVADHGRHKHESTRGFFAEGVQDHPILRGIRDGDIWGSSDVYRVRLPLPGDSRPLLLGQVVERQGDYDESDLDYGMRPADTQPVESKNAPMMPIAWIKSYQLPGGERGQAFTTTMGASSDLSSSALRRLLVNAVYWSLGLESRIPNDGVDVALVGEYEPTQFINHPPEYWRERMLRPADLR